MDEALDPTIDEVVVIVFTDEDKPLEIIYDVHGETEALDLVAQVFRLGAMIVVPADKDDPSALWDDVYHYPPHRVLTIRYMKRNTKPDTEPYEAAAATEQEA